MASSQIARLKAQLEAKTKAAEAVAEKQDLIHGHHYLARTQAERERIQIETARKMASRFNLTYRALALSAAKKTAENRLRDIQAAKEAKERAAKYQMTARSLQMSNTGTSTGRVKVLSMDTRYSEAYTMDEFMLDADLLEYSRGRKFTELSTVMSCAGGEGESAESSRIEDLDGSALTAPENNVDLCNAVRTFFAEHDAARMEETESLVQAYEGREEELLDELNRQYPEEPAAAPPPPPPVAAT